MADSDLQPMEFGESPAPSDVISDNACHYYHEGSYWLTFAVLTKEGQWLGKGCTSVGDHGDWDGTRFRGAVCAFGDTHWFCDVTLNPGETIVLRGTACSPGYVIMPRAELLDAIDAGFPSPRPSVT